MTETTKTKTTMTRRTFDAETKENWGSRCMASDERCGYRDRRHLEHNGSGADGPTATPMSLLDRRAVSMSARNARRPDGTLYNRDGFLPTLGLGSKWRAVAAYRAANGLPLLS